MEDTGHQKIMLNWYHVCQKVMPKGPDQASICDELGVRTGMFASLHRLIGESCRLQLGVELKVETSSQILSAPGSDAYVWC